jgi:hypothetical protein
MDIAEFLNARYDEDEVAASALDFVHIEATEGVWSSKYLTLRKSDGTVSHTSELPAALADHVVRHDPARVLADIAAKRRILAAFDADDAVWAEVRAAANGRPSFDHQRARSLQNETTLMVLRNLAAPYAEHPDYAAAWAVDAA